MITGASLTTHKHDHKFLDDAFSALPGTWAQPVAIQYKTKFREKGRAAANLSVLEALEVVGGNRIKVAADDHELREFAKDKAEECFRVAARYVDKDQALNSMLEIALRYGIGAPAGRNVTKTGQRMRLLSEHWWRRQVRKVAARNVEGAAIRYGLVSRKAGLYASDESVKRRAGQRRRNREILESIFAENDAGQSYSLAELSDLGVSNPEKRRMELMTRIAGFDAIALKEDHAAEFLTVTAPSKYHARHHITGREYKHYNQSTPAQTQAYFCNLWAKARAKLHREGISIYGFRVAEPHHDGTPHWHMMLFCEKKHVTRMREIIKHYAFLEDGDEVGADIHRFKAEPIDRSRGTAAGYLAKYIAKNIDGKNNQGESIGDDYEAVIGDDEATKTARRVDAWASTWGIRQFQQIGGQSVTLWRELRRAEAAEIQGERLRDITEAADVGAWDRYTMLNGGVLHKFYEFPRYSEKTGNPLKNGHRSIKEKFAHLEKKGALDLATGLITLNLYTEPAAPLVVGFCGGGEVIKTHEMEWFFKRNGEPVTPRSSVNNCTELDRKKNDREKKKAKIRYLREVKKRPLSAYIPIQPEKTEFLTGEDLEKWKKQQEKQPAQAPIVNVWPQCSRVLTHFALTRRP